MRCIIIGWGGISRGMQRFLSHKPWFEIAGVVDVNPDALANAKELIGASDDLLFKDIDQAIEKTSPDAALINTPSHMHYDQTKQVLAHGVHAMVAKPITNDFKQAVELVNLAEAQGVTLSVGQQVRYNRHYTAVKNFVDSGKLGDIEAVWFMNSKPRPKAGNLGDMSQPALYEMTCHHFDSLLHILNNPAPTWVSCDGFTPSWSPYAGPCMVNAMVRCEGNLHISYHGGFSSQSSMYELRIEGSAGSLKCSGIHMTNNTMDYEFAPALQAFEPIVIDEGIPNDDAWLRWSDLWHNYVQGGEEPPFSGRNNLKVFAMLCAAAESVETGRSVSIEQHPEYSLPFKSRVVEA